MKKLTYGLFVLGLLATCATGCSNNQNDLSIVHFDQSILGDTQKDLGVSIGVKKGNTTLQSALNSALATINADTRTTWMREAVDRAAGVYDTTGTTPYTVPTDTSLPVLKVGLECDYQPFNWTEVQSNSYTMPIVGTNQFADGYDIQMARYLANKMNYRLEIVKLGWEALIPALQGDTINAVIAGMTDTEERRQSIDFSNEYYRSELVLIVKADSDLAKATSLESFANKKIVSQVSTVTDDVIEDWVSAYKCEHLNALDTFATCAIAVRNGTADAMTAELPVAQAICNSGR